MLQFEAFLVLYHTEEGWQLDMDNENESHQYSMFAERENAIARAKYIGNEYDFQVKVTRVKFALTV